MPDSFDALVIFASYLSNFSLGHCARCVYFLDTPRPMVSPESLLERCFGIIILHLHTCVVFDTFAQRIPIGGARIPWGCEKNVPILPLMKSVVDYNLGLRYVLLLEEMFSFTKNSLSSEDTKKCPPFRHYEQ